MSRSQQVVFDALGRRAGPSTLAELSAATGLHVNTLREHLHALQVRGSVRRRRAAPNGRGRPAWLYELDHARVQPRGSGTTREVGGQLPYAGLAATLATAIQQTSPDPRAEGIRAGRGWGRALARDAGGLDGGGLDGLGASTGSARGSAGSARGSSGSARGSTGSARGSTGSARGSAGSALGSAGSARGSAGSARASTGSARASTGSARGPAESADQTAEPVDARRRLVDVLERLGFGPETGADVASVRLTCCPLLEAARRHPEVVCGVHLGIVQGALTEWNASTHGVDLLPFSEPGACRLLLPTDQPATSGDTHR